MVDKAKVQELYLKGFNSVEIAKEMGKSVASIRKYIQRNFGNLKDKHKDARRIKNNINRAVNYESKMYMSDRAFILNNRSIYKTLANGNIILDKSKAPVVTKDTPLILKNEKLII